MNQTWPVLLLIVGVCMHAPVSAQTVFDPNDSWADENDERYHAEVIDRYWGEIQREEWPEIFSGLKQSAAETEVDWSGAEEVHERFVGAIDAAISELKEIEAINNGIYLEHLDQLYTARFTEGTLGDGFVGFNGMNPAIVLCFAGAEQANPCNRPEHPILTEAQAEDIRYRANAANELLLILRADADRAILEEIESSYRKWTNFMDHGFVMYPWEISLNSAVKNWDIRTPPAGQFIFLHPAPGIQIPLDGFRDVKDLRVKETLMVELLGHLWYRGEYLENFSGLSATLVLREDLPPGIGVLVRPKRGMAAGLNWHWSPVDGKQFLKTPYLSVSVDLLQFISSNRGRLDL